MRGQHDGQRNSPARAIFIESAFFFSGISDSWCASQLAVSDLSARPSRCADEGHKKRKTALSGIRNLKKERPNAAPKGKFPFTQSREYCGK